MLRELDAGTDPNQKDADGLTALFCAAETGQLAVVEAPDHDAVAARGAKIQRVRHCATGAAYCSAARAHCSLSMLMLSTTADQLQHG